MKEKVFLALLGGLLIAFTVLLVLYTVDTACLLPGLHKWWARSLVFSAGLILATCGGIWPIGKLLGKWTPQVESESLRQAGRTIGILERFLVFILLIAGSPEAATIVPAIKSLVRVLGDKETRPPAEYYLIGTFASIGWALVFVFATTYLLT